MLCLTFVLVANMQIFFYSLGCSAGTWYKYYHFLDT